MFAYLALGDSVTTLIAGTKVNHWLNTLVDLQRGNTTVVDDDISGPPQGPQSSVRSVYRQYSRRVSPFQAKTIAVSRAMVMKAW